MSPQVLQRLETIPGRGQPAAEVACQVEGSIFGQDFEPALVCDRSDKDDSFPPELRDLEDWSDAEDLWFDQGA